MSSGNLFFSLSNLPRETDVFIAGGGPAGLAAAIALRKRRFDVVVADQALPPIEKTCGEGLLPETVVALQRLGVNIETDQAAAFRGIRFVSERVSVEAGFTNEYGVGVRRTILHQALADQALREGATILWRTRVQDLTDRGAWIHGQEIRARWVIGADGQHSRVRKWAELEPARKPKRRFAFQRHYRIAPWSAFMELHWARGCQLYITPVSATEISVVLMSDDPGLRFDQALPRFPELAAHLQSADIFSNERGTTSDTRRLSRVYNDRTILIGDASGSVDAITGEGMRLGFAHGLLLADALASGDLESYQREHRRLRVRPQFMADLLLAMGRCGWLRRRVFHAFETDPQIFHEMLAMHTGAGSALSFMRRGLLPLGWNLVTAFV